MNRLVVMLLLLAAAPRSAAAGEFVVRPGGDNKVSFISKAAMESFEGKTNRLSGRIVVDPAHLGDSATVHFEVDMASLDTGIAKRNQHMREAHLETAKFPKAIFDGVSIGNSSGAALAPGTPVPLEVDGTFTLHGVARRIHLTVTTVYKPSGAGGTIEFRTTFPVALPDYQISRPQFLFLKLAEAQQVTVKGIAVAGP